MNKTKIEWVKNPDGSQGYTWNPITGCLNGCTYCYARQLANGRLKQKYLSNTNIPLQRFAFPNAPAYQDPFFPRFWPERLTKSSRLISGYKEKGIFCCDMSDLFGIGIPEDWTRQVLSIIKFCNQNRFYLLTKQPQNLQKFSPFPDNCWVGVTATDAVKAHSAYMELSLIDAKVKYISFEPLLEGIDWYWLNNLIMPNINWLIIGSQTKPYNPPNMIWVKDIVDAADKAGVPVFLKNNLLRLLLDSPVQMHRALFSENYGKLRQELPNDT